MGICILLLIRFLDGQILCETHQDLLLQIQIKLDQDRLLCKNILPEYTGKNTQDGNLDEIEKGNFNIDWLIKHQFLDPIVKKSDDFQNISKTKEIEMKNFIRNVVKNDPSGEKPRIFLENIHTVKGEEYDNSVVDLATRREEEDFTKRRIKYVACSRAKKTLWLIKSKNGMTL